MRPHARDQAGPKCCILRRPASSDPQLAGKARQSCVAKAATLLRPDKHDRPAAALAQASRSNADRMVTGEPNESARKGGKAKQSNLLCDIRWTPWTQPRCLAPKI